MSSRLTPLVLALAATACATTADSSSRVSRNVITAEEIREVDALTAFDAVERLRPAFLRRGRVNVDGDTKSFPIVYLDDLKLGGIDELRRIRASQVARIEYLSAADATFRFGTGHSGGALLVTTVGSDGGA